MNLSNTILEDSYILKENPLKKKENQKKILDKMFIKAEKENADDFLWNVEVSVVNDEGDMEDYSEEEHKNDK